ncbi:hypothetical protein Zmor_025301 [Zophobas morio]|uniref:Uncharacterized protein n=1 Tax=Zophobas morio TaxID=2755281 RepID=A0AA38M3R3_9CUCU|nr:hypothetical protein Zmor_025301 [Zophobas morio]
MYRRSRSHQPRSRVILEFTSGTPFARTCSFAGTTKWTEKFRMSRPQRPKAPVPYRFESSLADTNEFLRKNLSRIRPCEFRDRHIGFHEDHSESVIK